MIIQYSENNENRIKWQHRRGGEWKTAELDELIEAYERATEPGDLISRAEAIRMYCKAGCGCEPSECGLTHEQDGAEECGVVRFLKSVPSVAGDLISRDEAINAVGEAIADGKGWYSALVKVPSAGKTDEGIEDNK